MVTLGQLAAGALEPLIYKAAADIIEEAAYEGLRIALRKSSGGLSYTMQRAMDHPYARRHGRPRADASTINAHTGAFRSAWRIRSGARVFHGMQIINDSFAADFLQYGTKTMFERPIKEAVEQELEAKMHLIAAPVLSNLALRI